MTKVRNESENTLAFGDTRTLVVLKPGETGDIVLNKEYEEMLKKGTIVDATYAKRVDVKPVAVKLKTKRPIQVNKEE